VTAPGVLSLGAVSPGVISRTTINATTNCTTGAPYSYSFSSLNGGATGGKLVSGTCSLTYSVVAFSVNGGLYGGVDYFTAPPSGTGTGGNQITNLGVVVGAVQPGCTLAANAAAITATDNLVVSINY
jgi:hypothetical protein